MLGTITPTTQLLTFDGDEVPVSRTGSWGLHRVLFPGLASRTREMV